MQQHATKRKEIKKRIECVIQLARHLLHLVCVCVCLCVCVSEKIKSMLTWLHI